MIKGAFDPEPEPVEIDLRKLATPVAISAISAMHSCPSQKTVYATRDAALEDRRRIRASFNRSRLYVYRCDRCDQFHLSSQKHQAVTRQLRRWDDQEQRRLGR